MHQLSRLSFRRDEVEPAPRSHPIVAKAQNVPGNRVAVMMVVEKPAIDLTGSQLGLNRFDIRHESKSCSLFSRSVPFFSDPHARLGLQRGYCLNRLSSHARNALRAAL